MIAGKANIPENIAEDRKRAALHTDVHASKPVEGFYK